MKGMKQITPAQRRMNDRILAGQVLKMGKAAAAEDDHECARIVLVSVKILLKYTLFWGDEDACDADLRRIINSSYEALKTDLEIIQVCRTPDEVAEDLAERAAETPAMREAQDEADDIVADDVERSYGRMVPR